MNTAPGLRLHRDYVEARRRSSVCRGAGVTSSGADRGGSTPRPRAVPGAIWQAGVTKDNEKLKVLLDGEPLVGCIAAGDGWAACLPEPRLASCPFSRRAPLGLGWLIDAFSEQVVLFGRVSIVRGE